MHFPSLCYMGTQGFKEGCFFAWLAARGVILTAENLRKKINYVSWCFMCKSLGDV